MRQFEIGLVLMLVVIFVMPVSRAYAEEEKSIELGQIEVKGKMENAFVETKGTQPYTESTLTKEGIKITGGPAQSSLAKTLDLFPSVNVESLDPYGLNKQGRFIRIRGQGAMSINYTLEGIPVDAQAGSISQENSFDMENISRVTLYRGAAPTDQGFGWGNTGGAVDMSILKPLDKPGFTLSESVGTFDFNRTYLRADTGKILPNLKSFLSYSYAESDKWHGEGGVKKEHVTFGTVFSPSSMVNAQLYFDYNKRDSDNYRSLTYAQMKDLSTYYRYDFNRTLTGTPRQDVYYYDFNKVSDDYLLLFGNIQIKPADNHTITIKPYFSRSHSLQYGNTTFNGSPAVWEWRQDRTEYGAIIDYKTRLFDTDLQVGYWIDMFKWPGYTSKAFRVSNTGALTFAGWERSLMEYDGYFRYDTPYITLHKTIGKLNANAGLKYLRFTQPKTIAYANTGVPDVSTDDVFDYANVDYRASVRGRSIDAFLPSAALSYALNEHVTPYFNYGRGYTLAYLGGGGHINTYWSNRARYDAMGVTADMLADEQDIPIADNFDLGARLKFGTWHITPTIFYSLYKDKNVTILDAATGIQSRQTVGKARAYGAELEIAGTLFDSVSAFASGTYNRSEFTKNVPSRSGTTDITGNQFPDTPQYMAKLGFTYTPHFLPNFQVSPIIRYVGSRYADATNDYNVSGYSTVDLNMTYALKNISSSLKDLTLGFYVSNIFNKKYISAISSADEARQTAATYYTGVPRTFVCSISGRF
ncbi:MAG: Ferrichrome-iron receptor precursor [Syntrophorhabdus sp. PtaU1.Bin002]|nr:MAG: Ferrichrome-iron receptor precursor [Syntrophorhabdus sp. PtaB.Bin006]OPY71322.1 MAG: Ferrichrome-iron receptor precursor [Syntrophorhabdus sp. PtaU1.Bin002]